MGVRIVGVSREALPENNLWISAKFDSKLSRQVAQLLLR